MARRMLNDRQWRRISPLLTGKHGDPGRTGANNRLTLEGILWIVRTGAPWRDLPPEFGKWNTIYIRFRRWAEAGVLRRLYARIAAPLLDLGVVMIDGTFVKVHQHGAGSLKRKRPPDGEAIGRSKGGLTTKILAATDRAGRLIRYLLLRGNAAESPGLEPLVGGIAERGSVVIADKAYDSDRIRKHLTADGIMPVIPSRSNRKRPYPLDEVHYKSRHLVENYFAKWKQFRRIATRYDKTDVSFAGMIDLAATVIALR